MQLKEKSTCWFSMPPLGSVVLLGGGETVASVARWSPICPVWWSQPLTFWGSENGLAFSKWTFVKNMYNTLHSDVLISPHRFPIITSLKHSESFSWVIQWSYKKTCDCDVKGSWSGCFCTEQTIDLMLGRCLVLKSHSYLTHQMLLMLLVCDNKHCSFKMM